LQTIIKEYGKKAGIIIGFILLVINFFNALTWIWSLVISLIFIFIGLLFRFHKSFARDFNKEEWLNVFGNGNSRYFFLLFLIALTWIPSLFKFPEKEKIKQQKVHITNPIFSKTDSTSFNVLILKFEDYVKNKETFCIGRALQENLNNLASNDRLILNLNIEYTDTIQQPRNKHEAIKVQNRNHSDLLIYGLARNVTDSCTSAEIAFRYVISKSVISKAKPAIKIKSFKHDSKYRHENSVEIEQDSLKINALSLSKWVKALINLKADKKNDAFLELDEILEDARDFYEISIENCDDEDYFVIKEMHNKKIRYSSIALTYYNLGLFEKALSTYDKAISIYPEEFAFYVNRGVVNSKLGYYQRSLNDFDKAINIEPKNSSLYSNRGIVYESLKQDLMAEKDFKTSISMDSSFSFPHYKLAHLLQKREKYNEAISYYSKTIYLDSMNAKAYHDRGVTYINLKNYKKGLSDIKRALVLKPVDIGFLNSLLVAYCALRDEKEALQIAQQLMSIAPENSKIYYNLGVLYSDTEKHKKAVSTFSKAISLDSLDAYSYNNRAFSLLKINKLDKAFNDLEKSKSLDKKNAWLYRNYACYYILKTKKQKAIQNLKKAIYMGYDDTVWLKSEKLLKPIRHTEDFNLILNEFLEK
jgi:tetratricopeptide (TPR) repeat protein